METCLFYCLFYCLLEHGNLFVLLSLPSAAKLEKNEVSLDQVIRYDLVRVTKKGLKNKPRVSNARFKSAFL